MSDHTHRNAGIGGRGLVIGLLVIVLFIAGLAVLGTSDPTVEPGTAVIDPAAPAAEGETVPAVTE